jgi:DNA-binding response OmpR family regulator
MVTARVLFISNDHETVRVWTYALEQRDIEIVPKDLSENISHWRVETYDLIIVDVQALQTSYGYLITQLRTETAVPILLLFPRYDESILLEAYAAGIDECIVLPVSPRIFVAKVASWLRRSKLIPTQLLEIFQIGHIRLEPAQRQIITVNNGIVKLTNLEFRVLHLLMKHPGQSLHASLIVDRIWGYTGRDEHILIKNVIYRLRRKIEPEPRQPRYIQYIPGEGYMFQP